MKGRATTRQNLYFPPQLRVSKLQANGRVLTDEEINHVFSTFSVYQPGYYTQELFNVNYNIIITSDDVYAVCETLYANDTRHVRIMLLAPLRGEEYKVIKEYSSHDFS